MATQAPPKYTVPPHVPPELVHNIGLIESPEFLAEPHLFMARLHETHPPIFYSAGTQSAGWNFIKHEDAFFMLRSAEYFTNRGGTPFPRDPANPFRLIPVEVDPPEHRKFRNILDPMLSPQGILALEGNIRKLANQLIDEVIDKGECQFDEAYGRPLPVSIFLDLMGLPQDMRDTFVEWAVDLLHATDPAVMGKAYWAICAYLEKAIEEKRRNPDDGAISRILRGTIDGEPMKASDAFGFTVFLFIAGLDTVFATLNNMWIWLAENPDRRREIISRPDDIMAITEEMARRWAVTFSGRTLLKDLEMRGVQMKAGDKVMSILPACNFDPEVFPNPLEVDFDRVRKHRVRKPILSFAGGVHSRMGAHLARLEIKIALQEWLRRIPEFSLKPGFKPEYRPGGVVGPEHLPLVW